MKKFFAKLMKKVKTMGRMKALKRVLPKCL